MSRIGKAPVAIPAGVEVKLDGHTLTCLLYTSTAEKDDAVVRSANNIQKVATTTVSELNVYDMLKYDVLVMTKDALEKIEEVYA